MKKYHFEGYIEMDDYAVITKNEEACIRNDIVEVLGYIADDVYDVKVTKVKELKGED